MRRWKRLDATSFDALIVDVDGLGLPFQEVADRLQPSRGRMNIVFIGSGFHDAPPRVAVPMLEKPIKVHELWRELERTQSTSDGAPVRDPAGPRPAR